MLFLANQVMKNCLAWQQTYVQLENERSFSNLAARIRFHQCCLCRPCGGFGSPTFIKAVSAAREPIASLCCFGPMLLHSSTNNSVTFSATLFLQLGCGKILLAHANQFPACLLGAGCNGIQDLLVHQCLKHPSLLLAESIFLSFFFMLARQHQFLAPHGTQWNQPWNQAIFRSYVDITKCWNQVEPIGTNPGTKPNPYVGKKTSNFGATWNQVEPTPEPSHFPMLGHKNRVTHHLLIIILIKSRGVWNQAAADSFF